MAKEGFWRGAGSDRDRRLVVSHANAAACWKEWTVGGQQWVFDSPGRFWPHRASLRIVDYSTGVELNERPRGSFLPSIPGLRGGSAPADPSVRSGVAVTGTCRIWDFVSFVFEIAGNPFKPKAWQLYSIFREM